MTPRCSVVQKTLVFCGERAKRTLPISYDFFTGVSFWTPACIYMRMTIRSFEGDIQPKMTEWPTKGSWRTQVKVSPWMSLVCWQPIADASMHQFSESCLVYECSCVLGRDNNNDFYIVYLETKKHNTAWWFQWCIKKRPHLDKATGKAPRHGKLGETTPKKKSNLGIVWGNIWYQSLPIITMKWILVVFYTTRGLEAWRFQN